MERGLRSLAQLTPDTINGAYEALGGLMLWRNVRQLYKDKQVRGISVLTTVFFTSWGVWNLYYYPHLDQWLSFAGGLVIVTANVAWVSQMFYYNRKERRDGIGRG